LNNTIVSLPNCLLLYCRSGFEKECSAEILERTTEIGLSGYVKAQPESGFVAFITHGTHEDLLCLNRHIRFNSLIFARQWVFASGPMSKLPVTDRITPLLEQAKTLADSFSEVFLETADTNEAKQLSVFVRKFTVPFNRTAQAAGLLGCKKAPRLHVFFLDSSSVYLGVSFHGNASPWLMGIPRLKFPSGAPSRSTLKLEEAFLIFLDQPEQQLRPGMSAVDLGAAPGGWTWQLVKHHIRTTAVDNGPLHPWLLETGIVTHLRVDGFSYRPQKPVDWLVCDMVEQPSRIAALVANWIGQGLCQRAIFNLKLPMKKRYEEVKRCREVIEDHLAKLGGEYELGFKQLYHDRAEITGYLGQTSSK
jgi:23S rRNA (cytidine2498-2'-O)-methyltransferase